MPQRPAENDKKVEKIVVKMTPKNKKNVAQNPRHKRKSASFATTW
jgi:hypothetical protein